MSANKTLIIAEKPSVAADLVKVLPGKFKKEKTHFEGEEYIVSYAVGHLVTLCEPAEMDENYKSWKMDVLPILPKTFLLKPIKTAKSQLSAVAKLLRKKDVKTIINACDAGREGELIFRYIIEYSASATTLKKEFKRLWLQSMTTASIKKAFENLRTDDEMKNLASAASCRSEADWLIGINASRGLTAYNSKDGGFFLTPSGRVQTPTLSMIVSREEERKAFISKDFYKVYMDFKNEKNTYTGTWFDPDFKKDPAQKHLTQDRLWEKPTAEEILERTTGKEAIVTETTKPSSKSCPPLYDLTTLQREANNRFGFSAKRTLGIAQSLYERYKVLTYPRTDSKFLPEDYIKDTYDVMAKLKGSGYEKSISKVIDNKWIKPSKKIFNNAKISDHHAIIPTGLLVSDLPEAEKKIYQMVLQRYIGVFFPPAEYQHTLRISAIGEDSFKTEGKVLVKPGWLEVYGKTTQEELLASIDLGKKTNSLEGEVEPGATTPPPRYTESTLLSAMEGAGKFVDDEEVAEALKERGLGTPATRVATI
jgi:DNA topoisomerase-3